MIGLFVMLAFSAVPSLWANDKQEQNTQVNALGTAENPDYIIETAEDLVALSTQGTTSTGKNFAGAWGTSSTSCYIKLVNDITLTADVLTPSDDDPNYYTWTPIGNGSNPFHSNFDGGGHTITFASQGILNSNITFALPALDGTEISFIINTPNYNDQVNYTNSSNISIQNGGRKIILISNTTTNINVEITSISGNINNSIVI